MAKSSSTKTAAQKSEQEAPKEVVKEVNEQVVEILQAAQEDIDALLTGSRYSAHKTTVDAAFNRLKIRFHSPGQSISGRERKVFPPIQPRELTDNEKATPASVQGEELEKEVNAIYDGFTERDTDEIIDSLTDIQIRGVARAAGLIEVTQTHPVIITPPFVEQIKAAIIKKAADKALISNPQEVFQNKIEQTEKELTGINDLKQVVEEALEKEEDPVKKENLQNRLEELTTKENELYSELDELNKGLVNNDSDKD